MPVKRKTNQIFNTSFTLYEKHYLNLYEAEFNPDNFKYLLLLRDSDTKLHEEYKTTENRAELITGIQLRLKQKGQEAPPQSWATVSKHSTSARTNLGEKKWR